MQDIRKNLLPAFIAGYSIVALIHLLGLLLLRLVKFQPINQRIVIIHLALAELCFNLSQALVYIFLMIGRCDNYSTCNHVDIFFFLLFGTANKLIMIYLIIDRLLDIHLHLRYSLYFPEQRVKNITLAIWFFCCIYAFTVVMLFRFRIRHLQVFWFVLVFLVASDAITVISAMITYVFLYIKVRRFCAIDNSQKRAGNNSNIIVSTKAKFLLPCLMIATYLIFNIPANVMFLHNKVFFKKNGHSKTVLSEILHWFWILGHFSDGLLYIFLQKDVKKKLMSLFKKKQVECTPGS